MMLKNPYINKKFEPGLSWFVGVLDVYDREETKGVELAAYNPNNARDREVLIRKYCLNLPYLSYRHKLALIENLAEKLRDPNYEFQLLFEIDPYEAASWPREEWDSLENPRGFFQELYRLAVEVWEQDLTRASEEDRSTW